MSAAHCPICFTNFTLDADKFAIFPCGHGFCTVCIGKLFADARPKCPSCRLPIVRRDAHPIHLDLVDHRTFFQTSVIEGLNKMGSDTPAHSVRKAGQKLGTILQDSKADSENVTLLLKAVEDFKERIIPTFTKTESQKRQIQSLLDDMRKLRKDKEVLQGRSKKLDSLQNENAKLKTALAETEQNTQEALLLAEAAKDELLAHRTSSVQWKKKATELEQDNKRYKDQLERHTNNARVQKEKNRKLAKEVAELKARIAADEREPISAASYDYDGDFSTHENSRVHLESSFRVQAMSPAKTRRYALHDENMAEFNPEGIPPPNFPTDWHIEGPNVLKKRTNNGTMVGTHRRVANPFPINLDRKGQPTSAVQLGPKTLIRVGP